MLPFDIEKILMSFVVFSCSLFCQLNNIHAALLTTSIKPNDSAASAETATLINFRRQYADYGPEGPRGPSVPPQFANRLSNKGKKFESQYLPYYPGGDWVYYRNASTSDPRPKILINETDPAYRDCNQVCIRAYLNYGQICAKRLNRYDWVYEYKEFDDICQMELENCSTVDKNWYPLRQGPCAATDFPIQPSDGTQIMKRLEEWEKRFLENPANDAVNPFVFTTATTKLKKTPKKNK